jgi:hypothetical protein
MSRRGGVVLWALARIIHAWRKGLSQKPTVVLDGRCTLPIALLTSYLRLGTSGSEEAAMQPPLPPQTMVREYRTTKEYEGVS